MQEYAVATYLVHDQQRDFHKKAEKIAVGLTVGSWTDLPQAQKEEMKKYLGQVEEVVELETEAQGQYAAIIKIAYPIRNFSADIPALLVTVFGKLSMDGDIKLLDIELPEAFVKHFKGPKYGISGVRELLGIHDRPLLMSIFKSCIGQDMNSLKEQFANQVLGGVDIVKDDEILFENPLSPFEARIELTAGIREQLEQETGQRHLYAVNLTGPSTTLLDRAKRAVELGASALLFNVFAYGYDQLQRLSEDAEVAVPIMAHPAMAGAFYPAPQHGIAAPLLLGKLLRLAGADLVLFPSPYGSVAMKREDTLGIAKQLRDEPFSGLKDAFPVPSAGIHPGLTPLLFQDFGLESVINAGGGIHGHPQGAQAGGRAFRQAIKLLLEGKKLSEHASEYPELAAAIKAWGLKE